jgi:haloalkane dehalogenase
MNWIIGVCNSIKIKTIAIVLCALAFSCKNEKTSMHPNSEYSKFISDQKQQTLSNGNSIKFIDKGKEEDKVILLIHGVPTSSWLYRKMIPLLVNQGYRVIAPDMLGYGQSDKPKGYDIYSPENMGSYLLELMDSLKISSWTHVCHDGGGLWTWEMLKKDPSKVKNLVLLNCIILKDGFNPPMQMNKNLLSRIYVKTYTSNLSRKGMMKATLANGMVNNELCSPEMVNGYTAPSEGRLDRALFQFFSNTCKKDLPNYEPLLRSLKIPVKVIWGKNDEILVWDKMSEKVKEALNLTEDNIHILEDAKHFIQEEKPNEIVELIVKN